MADRDPEDELRPVPDGSVELLMFAEGLILADHADALLTSAFRIGRPAEEQNEATIVLQFSGRVNHSDERRTVNVAVDPRGALDFAGSIFTLLEKLMASNGVDLEGGDRG